MGKKDKVVATQEEIAKDGLPHVKTETEEVNEAIEKAKEIADNIEGKEEFIDIEGDREEFIEHCLRVLRLPNQRFVKRWLKDRYPFLKEDTYGNLYHFNKDTPLLNAHMDNVGDEKENSMSFNIDIWQDEKTKKDFFANKRMTGKGKDARMETFNIGADDKCGVAIHTWIYDKIGDKVSLLFTCDEETGCRGSRHFMNVFKDEDGKSGKELVAENNLYCVLADRRHAYDFIGTKNNYCTKEWEDKVLGYIGSYGYKSVQGLGSDAGNIKDAVNCVNLSCGYYDPHGNKEHAIVDEMINCCNAIMFLVLNFKEKLEPYKYVYTAPEREYSSRYSAEKGLPFRGMGREGVVHDVSKHRYMKGKVYRQNKRGVRGRHDPLPVGHKRAFDGSRGSDGGDLSQGSDDTGTPEVGNNFEDEVAHAVNLMDDYDGMYDTHIPTHLVYKDIFTGDEHYIPAGYYLVSEVTDPGDDDLESIIGFK